jgi:hypothetical protein
MKKLASPNSGFFSLALCFVAILLLASGCGQRDDTKAARTEPAAAPAAPVTGEAGKALATAASTIQQCPKPAPGDADERPPTDESGHFPTPTDCAECARDWWRTNQKTVLRGLPRDEAPETGSLPANAWVRLIQDVALTKPMRGVVVVAGGGLQACDVVYAIDTVFEEGVHDHDRVWRGGKVFRVGQHKGVGDGDGGYGPGFPLVRFDETPVSGFSDNRWVKLRGPDGASGWARVQSDSFDCMWTNDRFLDGQPTICASPPKGE